MTTNPPLDKPVEQLAAENPMTTAAMEAAAAVIRYTLSTVLTEADLDPDTLDDAQMSELCSTLMLAGMTAGAASILEGHRKNVEQRMSEPAYMLLSLVGPDKARLYGELMALVDRELAHYAHGLTDELGKRAREIGMITEPAPSEGPV